MGDSRALTICAECRFGILPPINTSDVLHCQRPDSAREKTVDDITGHVAFVIKRGGIRAGSSQHEFPPCRDVKDSYREADGTCRYFKEAD